MLHHSLILVVLTPECVSVCSGQDAFDLVHQTEVMAGEEGVWWW